MNEEMAAEKKKKKETQSSKLGRKLRENWL
jgi:hypothetical protein